MDRQLLFLCVYSLILLSLQTEARRCRQTNGEGPQKDTPCYFPFIYKRKVLNECTDLSDPDGKFWCSTKVDDQGKHVGGADQWGYCDDNCDEYGPDDKTTGTDSAPIAPSKLPSLQSPSTTTEAVLRFGKASEYGTDQPRPGTESYCGTRSATGFILGGETAKRGDYPFIASLGYDRPSGRIYGCGGALINRRYVVTAAHCYSNEQPIVEVVLGEHDFSTDPDCDGCPLVQRFEITKKDVKVHEGFSLKDVASNGNDIALIRLPRLAITIEEDENQNVIPICLPWSSDIKVPDRETIVIGWGRTNNNVTDKDRSSSGALPNILQQLKVPQVPVEKCKDYKPFQNIDSEKQICAGGEKGKDSCKGDSGGPLITRKSISDPMYLIGVVSFGTRICGAGIPGVYTNISHYIGWIKNNLEP